MPISKCPYVFFKDCNKFKELSSVFGFRFIATHLGIFFSTLKETLFIFITLFIQLRSSKASIPLIYILALNL